MISRTRTFSPHLLAMAGLLLVTVAASPCVAQPGSAAPEAAPSPALAAEPDARNLALATEIIDLSYPPEVRHALVLRRVNALLDQIQAVAGERMGEINDAGARQIYDRYLARIRAEVDRLLAAQSPRTFAAYARAYARKFSYDELVAIRVFVRTPAGSRFLERASDVYADPDVALTLRESLATSMAALQPIEAEFAEEVRVYLERRRRNQPTGGPPTPGT